MGSQIDSGKPTGVLWSNPVFGGLAGSSPPATSDSWLLRILALQVGQRLATALGPEPDADAAGDAEPRALPSGDASGGRDAELARAICDVMADEVEPDRIIDAALRPVASELPAAPASLYLIEDGVLVLQGQCEGGGSSDRSRLPPDVGDCRSFGEAGDLT